MIFALFSCRSECEPHVRGGTEEERAFLQEAVDVFYDLLDPALELCVPSVRMGRTTPEDRVGDYNSATHRVRIWETRDFIVFHELCHAVQYQNDLPVEGPTWDLVTEDAADYPRHPEREAFANACEFGPTFSFLLGGACPYDPDGIEALFEARDLFTGPDRRVILEGGGVFTPTVRVPTAGGSFELELTERGAWVTTSEQATNVDLWTGQPLPGEEVLESPDGNRAFSEGGSLYLMTFEAPNGAITTRRVYGRSDQLLALGCLWPEERVFEFDGSLWSASLQEGAVVLGFWTPEG